ncbi:MAG TPA: hypothetical protein VG816_04755 [Solirubrobacterales bacterium]|nr:hypothetical protein [Solirubrobacterales bacterium]
MRLGIFQLGAGARTALRSLLAAGAMSVAMIGQVDDASADPCAGGSTEWQGVNGASFNSDANWSNGGPSSSCDTFITTAGTYTVSMTGGANMKSLTLGGPGSSPTLVITAAGPNTNLNATTSGIDIKAGANVVLTCPALPGGCNGGPTSGGASLNSGSAPFANHGTITVDAASGTGATIVGPLVNTGTVRIEQDTRMNNGAVVNQGALEIADGKTLTSSGSSCGDTAVSFKNDTGGSVSAAGTGTLSVVNYEQGNGATSGSLPVNMPCGTLKYTGNGASAVQANGGIDLSGEMKGNQQLTLNAASANTNARLVGGNFTNNGSITLTCPAFGCSGGPGGGAGFNANGNTFTNAGSFTVASSSETGANLSGGLTNTGTMQFDQSTVLNGVITNQGSIGIANGKTVSSFGESCGQPGSRVINDTGGAINSTGNGTLSLGNYEQGGGTTSGPSPVTMPCGSLQYVGTGAGTVQIDGIVTLAAGAPAAGQTLRIGGTLNASAAFTNAGTIALTSGTLGGGNTVTNGGRLVGVGTVSGSVDNTTGVVAPGSSPGTLAVNGGYTQGSGGSLEIEIAGTGVGQFDKLTIGGGATLGGTLALQPTSGYASSAALGDGIDFLTYGSSRTGQFGQVTTTPSLACPKQFALDYADAEKRVGVDVLDGPFSCGGGDTGGGSPSITPPAISLPASTAKKPVKCKKGFRKVKAKGKTQCKKIKKKKKHRKR